MVSHPYIVAYGKQSIKVYGFLAFRGPYLQINFITFLQPLSGADKLEVVCYETSFEGSSIFLVAVEVYFLGEVSIIPITF